MDDAAYEALMARLNEAYPSQPAYTPADVKLQSGQITRQQGQDPVMLMNPRTLQQGESNPIDFDQSGGIGQLGAMINAGRLRGMLDMSAQDGMTPGYNAMGTMQLPEGYSASYRRSNEIGGLGDAQNAIMLAKQFGKPNTPSPSLSAGASRSGTSGPITYDLSGSVPLTTGRNPEAPQFRLPSSREEQPMVPPSRRDRERQPSHQEVKGAATAGLSHSPRDHSTRANAGLKFNFADGGHVDAALHLLRHHLAGGGFLSDLFSGPDYLSTGEVASPTNWGDPELASDFFKADKALRLAREAQASEPARDMPLPLRRPVAEAAPRQQVAAPPPAPSPAPAQAFRPVATLPIGDVEPHDFPPVTMPSLAFSQPVYGEKTQRLGGGEDQNKAPVVQMDYTIGNAGALWPSSENDIQTYAGIVPEDFNEGIGNPMSVDDARQSMMFRPEPRAEVARAVSLAQNLAPQQEAIPSAADALAAVENLHNAGVYSGEALDKAGEILAAHNRAMFDNIPVDEALRLIRAEGPRMVNQGMPREERPAVQPLAYTTAPTPAPAQAAINTATTPTTNKLTARVDPNSDAERANNVWNRMLIQESGGRQFDRNGNTITSPVGALGISQVMPSTGPEAAQLAGLPWSLERLRTDPEYNHALGRAYYEAQLERFGDPTLAAAAYNGGPGRVAGALRQARETGQPWTAFLRPETQNYVRVVTRPERAEGGEIEGYAGGGDVIAKALAALRGGNKVFPKPQRLFPEGARPPGGEYINTATGEAITGQKPARAVIGVTPEGKPVFLTDTEQVDVTGSPGPGSTKTKTNLFKQQAGWKWNEAPEGYENVPTIVSAENRGQHYYGLGADFPKGVDLERYANASSEPRLRPTTQGNVYPGEQVGSIDVRGREHPVYDMLTIRNLLAGTSAGAVGAAAIPEDVPHEAHGGLVDDALHVVREHHADGEAVGPVEEPRPLTIYRGNAPVADEAGGSGREPAPAPPAFSYMPMPENVERQAARQPAYNPAERTWSDAGSTEGERLTRALGVEGELPKGETFMSATPTGLDKYMPQRVPGTFLKRWGEAFNENADAVEEGLKAVRAGNYGAGALGMLGGGLGMAISPLTGMERVLVRDPYLRMTGNLKDAQAAEMVADTALTGGLRGMVKPFAKAGNLEKLAAEPLTSAYRLPSPAATGAATAAGAMLAPEDAEAGNVDRALKLIRQATPARAGEAVLGAGPVRKSLNDIVGGWENKGVKLDVSGGGEKPLGISRIVVPEDMRNQGIGSQVMNDLIAHADDANKMMTLTPSKDFGASSVDRLRDFYKQFGFVENKGKNKDYAISDTMYRKPAAAEPQIGVKSSPIEAAQELANKATQAYGTTHNIAEAGYVLPNGKMLDFSGRHEAGYNRMGDRFVPKQGERDWLANDRAVDHRDVVRMMAGPEGMEGHEGMTKFMADASAIRNKPGIGFEAAAIPTNKQIKTIVSSHNTKYRGEPMTVELSHPITGDIVASRAFEKPNVEAIQKWFGEQAQENPDIKLAPKFSRGGKTSGSVEDRALMLISKQA